MRLSSIRRWYRQTVVKMAAHSDAPVRGSPPRDGGKFTHIWRKVFGKDQGSAAPINTPPASPPSSRPTSPAAAVALMRRVSRKVVPGLPRAKTFKRQQSEDRTRLEPTEPTQAERRAASVDRRVRPQRSQRSLSPVSQHRASAPDFLGAVQPPPVSHMFPAHAVAAPPSPIDHDYGWPVEHDAHSAQHDTQMEGQEEQPPLHSAAPSTADARSTTSSVYDSMLKHELETKWILNLSMHFRDRSKREKFFVTYHEKDDVWRRVTISLDYRNAPDDSLEKDLSVAKYQRDKSSRIYEAIRESLQDIQFYETVTNLKLQTTDGRLHVHVVEDVNEIIHYPTVQNIEHLQCKRVLERELEFDSHMSGFVYKVQHNGRVLIKKEIPGPDTVDEFLYEVNALSSLGCSPNIIRFYGVVVDDADHVKGLLIDFAEQGALVDVIYHAAESGGSIDWQLKQRWARQIVQGLSDVHEAGFVQGDFTLSNIVIDDDQNAKIIDINRRGCPVGWEPPEVTPLIDCNQRISMYIGVKSDLFQLGMVLWALATMEDEPEAHRRPLRIGGDIGVPKWYRSIVHTCLHEDPRCRLQAAELLKQFPEEAQTISVQEDDNVHGYEVADNDDSEWPRIRTAERQYTWTSNPYAYDAPASPSFSEDSYYPPRGRSPPSPLPGKSGILDASFFGRPVTRFALSDEEHTDDEAETPQETPTMENITKQLEHNLSGIEAKLLDTDGNSQKEEVMPPNAKSMLHNEAVGVPTESTKSYHDDSFTPQTQLRDQFPSEKLGGAEHKDQSKLLSRLDDAPPSNLETPGARKDDSAAMFSNASQADYVDLSEDEDGDSCGLMLEGACAEALDDLGKVQGGWNSDFTFRALPRGGQPLFTESVAFHEKSTSLRGLDPYHDEGDPLQGERGDAIQPHGLDGEIGTFPHKVPSPS
ncbi:serine/threonine-protein kinase TNNI3K [Microdochium nivale]|nr:serine/threonine-protein kinase TNNI3K [Microdochium nivale]